MKFLSIELESIFAYSERVVLNVGDVTPNRNIILIWGRNGTGKTSLLSAVKLLFLGVDDPLLRTVGFPPHRLGQRQYVLGDGAGWSGLINLHSRRQDAEVRARVRIVWEDTSGTVSAERWWSATPTGYREAVIVDDGKNRITGEPAIDRLADFLPKDFVPFFFFDGEDIKSLTEQAEGRKAVDIDRVLRISFITDLAEEVRQNAANRRRQSLPAEVRAEIAEVEGAIGKARASCEAAEQQIAMLEDQIATQQAERRHLQARRDNLRSGASSAEREALETREAELKEILEGQSADVNEQLPEVAPMIANPGLVKAALDALNEKIAASGRSEQVLIRRIQASLPGWLKEGPPTLHRATAAAIAETLAKRLEELVQMPAPTGVFANVDIARALRVRDALLRFSGSEQRRAHAQMLTAARRTRLELQRVRETLVQIEVGSQATLEEFKEITRKLVGVDEIIAELNQTLGQQRLRMSEAKATEVREGARLEQLHRKHMQATAQHRDAEYVEHIARSLNDLREELRQRLRKELQKIVNEKFRSLVHDYNLVDTIEIDDTYTLTFRDSNGLLVGRSSLSSGLKQLVATALLWALKEICQREVPVIIDTPLGRIDRENQENMLLNYYPSLAQQVLILPTNAEIDQRKFELVRERVAKQYRIFNDTGDRAEIRQGSLLN
jgi:DNA sulfur modification protein DndD